VQLGRFRLDEVKLDRLLLITCEKHIVCISKRQVELELQDRCVPSAFLSDNFFYSNIPYQMYWVGAPPITIYAARKKRMTAGSSHNWYLVSTKLRLGLNVASNFAAAMSSWCGFSNSYLWLPQSYQKALA
jgi:hypothetical protein